MQRGRELFPSLTVWVLLLFYGTAATTALASEKIAKIALDSTVHVSIVDDAQDSLHGIGSGFFVGPNMVATNYHVIEDLLIAKARLVGGVKLVGEEEIYIIEDIVVHNKERDLAVVKVREVKGAGIDVPALPLGDSDAVQIGETIYVAGSPQGLEGTFTKGIISGIRPEGISLVRGKVLQMNASISQGSSGGPVLNEIGKVIGISVGHRIDGQNLNFAIPVNYLKAIMPTTPIPVKPEQAKPKVDPPPVRPKPTKPQADLPSTEPKPALTPQEIAKTALGSTVHLSVRDAKGESWTGSGFVVDDGQIATNYHVIDNMLVGGARLVGKEEIYPIEAILAGDKERDLAVIKVAGIDAPTLPLGDSDTVEVMDTIYVAGNPQGWEGTVVPGNISAIRQFEDRVPLKFFQMTAPISQGSSGGPVVNEKGEVVGISFATHRNGQNLNFAIPVNYLKIIMTTTPTPVKPKQAKVDPPPVESMSIKPQADPPPTERKLALKPLEIKKIANRSMMLLRVMDLSGKRGSASGFVVHGGYIATNYHVVENLLIGRAKLIGKKKWHYFRGPILMTDKEHDLAVVKVAGMNAPALRLGDSDTVKIDDLIYAASNPPGPEDRPMEGTVTIGRIRNIQRAAMLSSGKRLLGKKLQIDASVEPGSSGGPVLNDRGEVIGIIVAGYSGALEEEYVPMGYNYAIAVNHLKQLAKRHGIPITPTPPEEPPIMKHVPPSRVSVGDQISLTLDLTGSKAPRQVTIHYKIYDKNGNELEPNNRKMRLGSKRPASSTRIYRVDLPAQNHVGSIEYYIAVEYDNHSRFRDPSDQNRHYRVPIVDDKPPTISVGYPPPDAKFGPNREVVFRAEVTDNTAVKEVHIHISSPFNDPQSYKLIAKGSSDIYTIPITFANMTNLRYHLTATDEEGNEGRSKDRHLEIRITPQENLENGIKFYEEAGYREAIIALSAAVQELKDPKDRAEAYLYLGGAKRGAGEGSDKVRGQFHNAIRHNPDQELPPRLGKDHPIFAELIEEVRQELTGELTVISLLPETKIWIEGNEVDRKMLGAGIVERRLLKGSYIVEGIYAGGSKRRNVTIEPNRHKEIDLGIPPDIKHDSPSRISVGERVPLTLDLSSTKSPQQVKVYYKTYDRDNSELEQDDQEMSLWGQQSAPSTWVYNVDLPAQKHAGSIEYYIAVEYENHGVFRHPRDQYDHHQISIVGDNGPTISLLYPPDGEKFKRDQKITIRAEVRSSLSIKAVHVHFSSSSRQKMSQENSSDVYTTQITVSQPLRYYLIVTDEAGNISESESRRIEIKGASVEVDDDEESELEQGEDNTPTDSGRTENDPSVSPVYQGIWASVSAEAASTSAGDGSYMFGLAYLREGKTHPTLGAQLDFSPDRTNMSAMLQWGPALGKHRVAFALLGGVAQYEDFPGSTHTTPIFGGGLKLYPLDKIAINATSLIKFPSDFETTRLYSYEVGIRFYITRELSLRAGYGQLFLGDRNIPTIQFGLGYTF